MPRRVDNAQPQLPERQLLAVGETTERVGDDRGAMEAELGAVRRGELARAGHVVGVHVGINHQTQLEAALGQEGVVLIGDDRWIDDCRLVSLTRGDDVRRTTAFVVEDLLEIHRVALSINYLYTRS